MSFPYHCKNPACGSYETEWHAKVLHCLRCGRWTDVNGNLVSVEKQYGNTQLADPEAI